MRRRISENDWKRIQQFAVRPRHERDPDLLLPETQDSEAGDDAAYEAGNEPSPEEVSGD